MTSDVLIGRLDALLLSRPHVRRGQMFGHAAYYSDGKMFACVYGDVVGLKLPETFAAKLVSRGQAKSFQPYGKRKMREWVQLSRDQVLLDEHTNTIVAAENFVGSTKRRPEQ